MPLSDAELAAFQSALLELLAQPLTPAEIARRLQTDPAFTAHRDYIGSFDPRMIEVAALLVKKWGRRSDESAP